MFTLPLLVLLTPLVLSLLLPVVHVLLSLSAVRLAKGDGQPKATTTSKDTR